MISCCLAFQTYAEFKVLFSLLLKNRGLYLFTLKQTISLTLYHCIHFLCSCLIGLQIIIYAAVAERNKTWAIVDEWIYKIPSDVGEDKFNSLSILNVGM